MTLTRRRASCCANTMNNTAKLKYIKQAVVRKYAKTKGKRVSVEFLMTLDTIVEQAVFTATKEHNNGKKTLTAHLLVTPAKAE